MRDKITDILVEHLSVTDEWGGEKLAGWRYGLNVVVDGIDEAVDEIVRLLGDGQEE